MAPIDRARAVAVAATALLLAGLSAQEARRPAGVDASQKERPGTPAAPVATGPQWRWVDDWGRLQAGEELGSTHGCLCVDRQGRILANTDTDRPVVMFAADGKVLGHWGKDYQGGLHGMCLRQEGDTEFLYLAHTGRHEVLKATPDGKVVWTVGWPAQAGIYQDESEYRPTAIAVAKDGRMFVADGYGKSWVHAYDHEQRYQKSFGGPGSEPGKFQTPHGLWIDARGERELLLVCDRENHRLQWFTLDGEFVREVHEGLLRPCNVCPLPDGGLAVADLAGRLVLLDRDDKVTQVLGEAAPPAQRATNQVPRDQWRRGVLYAPHSVCIDAAGALYVMDWNATGRISKFEPVAAAAAK